MKKEESPAADPGRNDGTIGQAILRLRTEKRLSANALAKAIGVSGFSVRRWEQGQGEPHFQSAQALDNYFDSDLVARFGAQLRGVPISRFIPRAEDATEQAAPQGPEKFSKPECSIPDEPAAAEQKIAAAPWPAPELQLDDQALRVISNVADKLMLMAGGLLQAVKTLREGRK